MHLGAGIEAPDRAHPIALANGVELPRPGALLAGSAKTVRQMPPS